MRPPFSTFSLHLLQAPTPDAAADALTSTLHGLAASTSSSSPVSSTPARLLLALAEVEAGRGAWRAAADAAWRAVEAASGDDDAIAVRKAALDARVRACLTAGWDEDALKACAAEAGLEEAAGGGPSLPTVALSALHAHATGLAPAAGSLAAALRGVLLYDEQPDQMEYLIAHDPMVIVWAAARAGGVFAAAGGEAGRAAARSVLGCGPATAAASAAAAAPLTAPSGPVARGEVTASLAACAAQLALAERDWAAAEDAASAALAAATGEGGGGGGGGAGPSATTPALPRHPASAAAPLLILGDVFARRAQVTVAEGLLRRAALDAGLAEPSGGGGGQQQRVWAASVSASHPPPVHPSLASTIAWRMAQLLSLTPNRGTEARRWAGLAAAAGGLGGDEDALATALGPLDGLKGGVVAGMAGPFVDVSIRRVLPHLGEAGLGADEDGGESE